MCKYVGINVCRNVCKNVSRDEVYFTKRNNEMSFPFHKEMQRYFTEWTRGDRGIVNVSEIILIRNGWFGLLQIKIAIKDSR